MSESDDMEGWDIMNSTSQNHLNDIEQEINRTMDDYDHDEAHI